MTATETLAPRSLAAAICLTILAGVLLAATDAVGKILSDHASVWQAAWARYVFHTLFVVGFLSRRYGWRLVQTRRPGLQLLRGLILLVTTLMMYTSVVLTSLANATTIQFLSPILVVIWAALFLGERPTSRHWVAVGGGFAGTVIVIDPDLGRILTPEVLLPLGVAFCMSVFLILTRILSTDEERGCTQFATTAIGALALTLALPLFWVRPSLHDLGLMLAIGGFGALGHSALLAAYARARASTLTPFLYSQVLGAALITVFWFGDTLSTRLTLGTVILVSSGIFLWWQERRANRRAAAAYISIPPEREIRT
ncbi:DMT family transporter [Oceanicola sp. 502str15]|uniref:DMT family transporter n=1 Tax=Oceanicola sp. 502str15 TaxID=2696061 RepID=UPI00209440C6|nr:DMT family transporter [Oceanicola sp. 502str15]MCO6384413.1 EamA family transporter [Oceanicola sp. 502str15]